MDLCGKLLEIPLDDLVLYEKCGGGTYGTVHRALWCSQDKTVAVKRLLELEKEAQVLNLISHKNIIKFFGAVSKDAKDGYCLITEYAPNGSLYAFLRETANEVDFKRIVTWATEIARGVHYLHYESPVKIIHRDLKSKNVVISEDWTCKICDFGASRFTLNTTQMTMAGTVPWMSPEAIESQAVSEATDVWSYGVLLWELLTKEIPYNGLNSARVMWLIVENKQRLTIPTECPPSFRRLLEKCWMTDPKKRPNLKQILALLHGLLEDESLPGLTNSFLDHKKDWKKEIEATLEQLKKAERAISNREQEVMQREMKVELREKLVQKNNFVKLEDHNIASWRDVDVCQWVMQLRRSHHTSDLAQYADLFLANHINGRRLLILEDSHLREMGITSVGHCIDLMVEIRNLKIHNFRLVNFPPLGSKTSEPNMAVLNQVSKETISVVLIFGHYLRKGRTDEETKWKMFAEIDQDEDSDKPAINLVKEVSFNCKTPDCETYTLNHSPFTMSSWCRGVSSDMNVECVVTYESIVEKPKSTRYTYQVDGRNSTSQECSVVLTLKKLTKASPVENDDESPPPDLCSLPVSPIPTNTSFSISSNASQNNLPKAWTKSFYPVELPPSKSSSKADLWSSVVSGKRLSISKPIPGTTEYIKDFPPASYSQALGRNCAISPISPSAKPSFTIGGGDSICSSTSNNLTTDSVLSNTSRNSNSEWTNQNQNNTNNTPGNYRKNLSPGVNQNNLSPGVHNEGFKKPRPFSAGVSRENNNNYNGGRRKITFAENVDKRHPMDRQMSRQTRSEPNKTKRENMHNSNYRRAFSGGPTVYLTGGQQRQGSRQDKEDQGRGDKRDRGNPFFNQRPGGNQPKFNRNNSREDRGKYNSPRGEGGGDYERRQSNEWRVANGYVNRGNDKKDECRGSNKSDRDEKKSKSGNMNKHNLHLKGENTECISKGSDQDDWTTVNRKNSFKS